MRNHSKNHKITALILLALFLFIAWFFIFFRVRQVEVAGSTHYSDEQVKDIVLKGPLAGNSLLAPVFCSRKNTGEISFIDAVEVSYVEPGSILIGVKEKQSIGCVPYLDCYVYFDREGMAIESSVEKDREIPCYEGMELSSVCLNQPLCLGDGDFLRVAVSLFQMIQESDRKPDHIQIDGHGKISLIYGGVRADLGKNEYLDDKIARMSAVLPLIEGRNGTLHLENVTSEKKNITFEEGK